MMRYGVFYALTGTKNAKHLDIKGQSALVVSISGPSFYPISFNFDLRNGQYSYSSFSDQITTSHGFYALLVQMAVSDPRVLACFSQAERQALGEDLSNRIRFGLVDDETAWRLLQALGKVSKDKALSVMATLTNHPNSDIAQKSRAILQKNKG
jgi:hypothetical protein